MSTEPYIGQISIFAGNFAPRGWAQCNGQLLSIAQNTALFSILGTTYGGDGRVTFALPDLRGRVPVHMGQGPGLSNYVEGEASGSETVTLISTQMPAHTHIVTCSGSAGAIDNPTNAVPGLATESTTRNPVNSYNPTADATMAVSMVQPAGGSQPHQNLQPFLVLNFIIATEGIFPSRN
jgi:microcystin-dependent protein